MTPERYNQIDEEEDKTTEKKEPDLASELALLQRQVQQEIEKRQQVEQKLAQREQELVLLSRAALAFHVSLNQEETLSIVLEAIRYSMQVTACRIWFVDEEAGNLYCQQVNEMGSKTISDVRLAIGEGVAGWVAKHRKSLIIPDVEWDDRFFKVVDAQVFAITRSILNIPLLVKQNLIGVLQVLDSKVNRFSQVDLRFLESLGAMAAIALENARLYTQAQVDTKTKEALLQQVNHRVKNNLATIIGLLYTSRERHSLKDSAIYQNFTEDVIIQVQGLATLHSMLVASEWKPLQLSKLIEEMTHTVSSLFNHNKSVTIHVVDSPVQVSSGQASNLALIINELTVNALKYIPQTTVQITAEITQQKDQIQLTFCDNGPGYPEAILQLNADAYGVGFDIIQNIVIYNLGGELSLYNNNGAVTVMTFAVAV